MPRNEQDPAASTQQFRAFASGNQAAPRQGLNTGVVVGVVAAVVVIVVIAAVLLVS